MPKHGPTALVPDALAYRGAVASWSALADAGVSRAELRAQLRAHRWQRFGRAVVLHNAEPTVQQHRLVALMNCGKRALLTSFTYAEACGLRRWERPEVHVLVPNGTTDPGLPNVVIHTTGDWNRVRAVPQRRLHDLAQSLVIAASSFRSSRPATGILAAAVQQRLIRPSDLRSAVQAASRTRHRRALLASLGDIEQGADALSEIDLGRLCRRYGLPAPTRQAVRIDISGRRRYLDGEWELPNGHVVGIEVDGAHHVDVATWRSDQMRQNEIVLGGTRVLRYPSVVIRDEPELVAAQLRIALRLPTL